MSRERAANGAGTRPTAGGLPGDDPRVLLFMQAGRDRELLTETLRERYQVDATAEAGALEREFDCCVLDRAQFGRTAETVRDMQTDGRGVFLPFVLLVGDDSTGGTNVWEYVDDVIELPVKEAELVTRIGNLIERRRTAIELFERTTQLEETVEDLRLKERAIDEAPVGFTITDVGEEGEPIVYANEQFEEITGYDRSEIMGRDHRFLQGEGTDPDARAAFREAIDARGSTSVDVLNYRQNGETFWNSVDIAPIHGEEGVTHYVGFQTEITDRKLRERRLDVLNRVLSHNLRNTMTVVDGHVALLRDEYDDGEVPDSLEHVEAAVSDLMGLAETVREIERTISAAEATETAIRLGDRLEQLLSGFEDRYPEATFDLTLPEEGCEVTATGLVDAIKEGVENAVKHNDGEEPTVDVRVRERPDGWVDVEIEDDGPGIPEQEVAVLGDGETPLYHADRLGLWLIYWVLGRAGGDLSVADAEPEGTVLTLSVPPGRSR